MLILSGGGIGQDAKEAYQALAKNIGDKKTILYIPFAWEDETFKGCREFVFNELKDYGDFEIHMLKDKSEFSNLDIDSYGAMFIGGGNTYKLLKYLKESAGYAFINNFISTDKPILGEALEQ